MNFPTAPGYFWMSKDGWKPEIVLVRVKGVDFAMRSSVESHNFEEELHLDHKHLDGCRFVGPIAMPAEVS